MRKKVCNLWVMTVYDKLRFDITLFILNKFVSKFLYYGVKWLYQMICAIMNLISATHLAALCN